MIYFNGEILPADQIRIAPDDRGLLLGDGVFETVPVYQGVPFKIQAHLKRLKSGAETTKIKLKQNGEELQAAIEELLNANMLENSDAVVRITLTRGPARRGLSISSAQSPTLLITASPWERQAPAPTRAIISKIRRNEHSPLCNIKSLNFLDSILAKEEAETSMVDEAILLNMAGNLAEAAAANLFIVKGEALFTPRLSDGALPGITRAVVIGLAQKADINTSETTLTPDDLFQADETFLTSSLSEIRPLIQIGDHIFGDAGGAVTARLANDYRELVIANTNPGGRA